MFSYVFDRVPRREAAYLTSARSMEIDAGERGILPFITSASSRVPRRRP
jgi:hypothetical protein